MIYTIKLKLERLRELFNNKREAYIFLIGVLAGMFSISVIAFSLKKILGL